MDKKFKHNEKAGQPGVLRFHDRWNINVDLDDAKRHFVNRVLNEIDSKFNGLARHHDYPYLYDKEMEYIASVLGVEASGASPFIHYSGEDFTTLLQCIEAFYEALGEYKSMSSWKQDNLDAIVNRALSMSEVDLGIDWKDGKFWPSGAKLFDEDLVDEPLKWLADPKYKNVLQPFQKGLKHYMEATKDQSKLPDIITDMYEALEALARIVNGNDKNLSANAAQFVDNLGLSEYYAKMLNEYCQYAHQYRHAVRQAKGRIPPKPQEVEAFIYTTGLFIRLAIHPS